MSATLEIEGQQLIAFAGGPLHSHTPAFSLYVNCETQQEGMLLVRSAAAW